MIAIRGPKHLDRPADMTIARAILDEALGEPILGVWICPNRSPGDGGPRGEVQTPFEMGPLLGRVSAWVEAEPRLRVDPHWWGDIVAWTAGYLIVTSDQDPHGDFVYSIARNPPSPSLSLVAGPPSKA